MVCSGTFINLNLSPRDLPITSQPRRHNIGCISKALFLDFKHSPVNIHTPSCPYTHSLVDPHSTKDKPARKTGVLHLCLPDADVLMNCARGARKFRRGSPDTPKIQHRPHVYVHLSQLPPPRMMIETSFEPTLSRTYS